MLALRASEATDAGSLPAPVSRFEAVGLAAGLMALYGLILLATGELDEPSVATTGLVILGVGLVLVALAREEISKILIGIVGLAGLVLAISPQISDGLFYESAARFSGALLAAPAVALLVQALWIRWRGLRSRIAVGVVAGVGLMTGFGAPLSTSGIIQPAEPEVAQESEPEVAAPSTTSTTRQTTTIARPCALAQLSTLNTEAEALETAARIDGLTSPGATIVGPSEWLPGWGPGRYVVFQRFATNTEATAFLAELGPAGSGAAIIELEAGADACG